HTPPDVYRRLADLIATSGRGNPTRHFSTAIPMTIWHTKLAARIHDPAEKALVMLRDPAGHEGGTSRALTRLLGLSDAPAENIDPDNDAVLSTVIFKKGLPLSIYRHVQRADWWAAAADRPQWPMQEITVATKTGEQRTRQIADWAQVRWTKKSVLIHPLTGEQYELPGGLSETDIGGIKQRSFNHFSRLLTALGANDEATQDLRKILLAYWRFGPDLVPANPEIHALGRGALPTETWFSPSSTPSAAQFLIRPPRTDLS
ncbi:MAG: hypothetical protein ACREXT_18785, partial [Gammaproteobacteria bacterium]